MGGNVKLEELAALHGRYRPEAYAFVAEGLHLAAERTGKLHRQGSARHLDAQELLDGVLALAAERYGLLADRVLNRWGIYRSEDVGAITFHLIEAEVLGGQPGDREEDFANGPNFSAEIIRLVRADLHGAGVGRRGD